MKPESRLFTALPLLLYRISVKKPLIAVLAVLTLLGVSALALLSTPLASDITRLIPTHAEKTSLYFRLMEDFGTMNKLYVVFTSDNINARLDTIDRAGEDLMALDTIETAKWKISPETKTFVRDTLLPKLPLYLSQDEMEEFVHRLSPDGMETALKKTEQRLKLPGGSAGLMDPLGIYGMFQGRIRLADVDVDLASGYYITPDGKRLIMTATPTGSPRDISFIRRLMAQVDTALAPYNGEGLKIQVTGNHAITLHEASIVRGEIFRNFLIALFSVLLIFVLFLRGIKGMVASIVPVVLSIGVTTGLASFAAGAITEISGGFAGLLIGLGADLGIVLYVRYTLLASAGTMPPAEAMEQSVRTAGAGITVGVLTTAVTFLPMLISSFRGIRELGLLTGMGIIVTLLLLFSLFPMLASRRSVTRSTFRGSVHSGAVVSVFRFAYDRPGLMITAALIITVALGAFIPRVEVEGDLTRLGSRKNAARDVLYELERDYMPRKPLVITGTASTPRKAAELAASVEAALPEASRNKVLSISSLLPPLTRQQNNIARLQTLDAKEITGNFLDTARSLDMRTEPFKGYLEALEKTLTNTEPVKFEDLAPLGEFLERVIREEEGGSWRFVVSAPDEGVVPAGIEGIRYTGANHMRKELLGLLTRDAVFITVLGLVLVNIILYASFRRLSQVLLCQGPVLLASVWLLGLMGLLGISFNFMNAIVFVMLFGIGTDYTIHLLHRRRQGGDITEIAHDTGTAVVLAGLTTLAGFGSMGLSAYRGLASLGAAAGLGVMACVIVSVTLIPAFFSLQERHQRNAKRH